MSAKLLSSSTDDDTKKTGCISIHKFFNRTTSSPTGQHIISHSHHRLNSLIDSPRPLPAHAKVQESVVLPRSSLDECESRVIMKINQPPRFSLDSRATATKVSLHLQMENQNPIKQNRSRIIAKLMGLEAFPDSLYKSGERMHHQPSSFSSDHGETEKQITVIESSRSNKDLRALKQILESIPKMNHRLENQSGAYGKLRQRRHGLNQKHDSLICQNRTTYQQKPAVRTCFHKPLICSDENKKSNLNKEIMILSSIHPITMVDLNKPACKKKAKEFTPRNNSHKRSSEHLSSMNKNGTQKREQTSRVPELKKENCIKPGRVNPKFNSNPFKVQGEFPPKNKHCNKNICEKYAGSKRSHSKSAKLQSNDEKISEHSTDTRHSSKQGDTASVKSESNNSEVSQIETDVTSFLPNSIITKSREQNCLQNLEESLPSVELGTNVMDQPSPVSVLDTTFSNEEAPSPVAKLSTAFQEERIRPEGEWYTKKPVHYKEGANGSENLNLNRDQRYINGPLLFSSNLNDRSISWKSDRVSDFQKLDKVCCSWILSDSKIFKDLEEVEDPIKSGKWKFTEKKDKNLNRQNTQEKIVQDMADEILIRKITMGGLFTSGRKRTNLQTVMKEVSLEIGHRCNMTYWNLDDEDDGMIKLLTAELKYQPEDWKEFGDEVPYLVLDIERQIFKDLMNEMVTDEVSGLHDLSKIRV